MALIDLFDIKKSYDVKKLLDGVDFHLNEGERVAIVGANGAGKSTLMKIALGEVEPSDGKRVVDGSVEIKMLSQQPKFDANATVREAILAQLTELLDAQKEYEEVSSKLISQHH